MSRRSKCSVGPRHFVVGDVVHHDMMGALVVITALHGREHYSIRFLETPPGDSGLSWTCHYDRVSPVESEHIATMFAR